MEINHQEGESCEESLDFALGVAARKLAKFHTQALLPPHALAAVSPAPALVRGWVAIT